MKICLMLLAASSVTGAPQVRRRRTTTTTTTTTQQQQNQRERKAAVPNPCDIRGYRGPECYEEPKRDEDFKPCGRGDPDCSNRGRGEDTIQDYGAPKMEPCYKYRISGRPVPRDCPEEEEPPMIEQGSTRTATFEEFDHDYWDNYIPPDYISPEFSDFSSAFNDNKIDGEDCPSESGYQSFLTGLSCSGVYCRAMKIKCSYGNTLSYPGDYMMKTTGHSYTTLGISEENGFHDCPHNYVVTGLLCTDRFCDKLHLECQKMANLEIDYEQCDETNSISTKTSEMIGDDGIIEVPKFGMATGLHCEGAYCETKRIRFCMPSGIW